MKSIQETIDKFQEDICKWDLYKDVFPSQQPQPSTLSKPTFYSVEEYLHQRK